jgi:hypothetical protein
LPEQFKELRLHTPALHTASGQPGSGKTALLGSIADELHRRWGKELYVILKTTDRRIEDYGLPKWIHSLPAEAEHPQDSIILGDDWQRIAPARRAVSDINVAIDELLGTLRHDNNDYLLDCQTYASLDRNSVLRTDYRWYKKPYADEAAFARPEIQEEVEEATELLEHEPIGSAYLSSRNREGYEGLVKDVPLPTWWTEEVSTMHRRHTQGLMYRTQEGLRRFKIL